MSDKQKRDLVQLIKRVHDASASTGENLGKLVNVVEALVVRLIDLERQVADLQGRKK